MVAGRFKDTGGSRTMCVDSTDPFAMNEPCVSIHLVWTLSQWLVGTLCVDSTDPFSMNDTFN